jgi:aspartate kinase
MITAQPEAPGLAVSGATLVKSEARVTILGVPDNPGTSLTIFSKIAAKNISVDMIVQNVGADSKADISFTVLKDDLKATLRAVKEAADELGAEGVSHDDNVSKVSVVGLGMATQTGVAQKMFRALAAADVNIQMITTSEIKISVLVAREQGLTALRTVHRVFELDKPPAGVAPQAGKPAPLPMAQHKAGDAAAVVARLQGMEDLTISDIKLDDSQSRVTISDVPDAPGVAAQVFERIAAGGIFVDMIVQSFGRQGRANLSFTVPRSDLQKAVDVARELGGRLHCGPVSSSPRVAKLSVSGIGMRSHTGLSIRMFRSLAESGINIEMINTSEVRVNVAIDGDKGPQGLACLQQAFSDATR